MMCIWLYLPKKPKTIVIITCTNITSNMMYIHIKSHYLLIIIFLSQWIIFVIVCYEIVVSNN